MRTVKEKFTKTDEATNKVAGFYENNKAYIWFLAGAIFAIALDVVLD